MNVCVTAGPTREYIDPVRFISNRSSGKMGYALAQVIAEAGHNVDLISGPVSLAAPEKVRLTPVQTAADMLNAVLEKLPEMDMLIMAAAVSDYTLPEINPHKIKKQEDCLTLSLVKTQDVLKNVSQQSHHAFVVGFAAESEHLLENARIKLESKHLDMIVANNILTEGIGFGSDQNAGVMLFPEGHQQVIEKCSKYDFAKAIFASACERMAHNAPLEKQESM